MKNKAENGQGRIDWRHSIFTRFFLLINLLIIFEVVFYLILNSTFFVTYYVKEKKNELIKAYDQIDEIYKSTALNDEERSKLLEKISNDINMQMMVFSEDNKLLYSTLPTDAERFKNRAADGNSDNAEPQPPPEGERGPFGRRGGDNNDVWQHSVLTETDNYVIVSSYIEAIDSRNIELHGTIENGSRVMLMVSVASIRESVKIANRFFITVGIFACLCAIVLGILISRRATKNIKNLSEAANRMARLDFSVKYTGNSHDEISVLGESLNTLSYGLEKAISDLKKANIELTKDIDKKEETDKRRKEFLSNVSHELKTPISIIEAYAEGLNEMELDEESRRYYCDVILDESKKMGMIIQKLMSLMRIETGSEALSIERYDIAEQIERIIEQKKILIEQSGAVVEFDNRGAVYVWADEFLIEEAFINFLINAVKYCGEEKKIKIFIENNGGKVRVSVYNSGFIADEDINEIWKSFYRADKARTRENGGCGLGLSIVAAIIDAHGHNCGVYNKDSGVIFWFEVDGDVVREK